MVAMILTCNTARFQTMIRRKEKQSHSPWSEIIVAGNNTLKEQKHHQKHMDLNKSKMIKYYIFLILF